MRTLRGSHEINTFAGAEARLVDRLPGYEPRPQQQAIARAIEQAIVNGQPLLAQAGCGVGKSLASMIPAILSGKRTVVSTATIALQEQYFQKDVPFLQDNLGVEFSWALLKGRSNYVCLARASECKADDLPQIDAVRSELVPEFDGDVEHLATPVDRRDRQHITISSADCPGRRDCPFGNQCYAEKAKAKARDAQVVITNHAMLLTDLKVRESSGGLANMLDAYEVVVLDEAHEVEEIATNQLRDELRIGGIAKFCSEVTNFARNYGPSHRDATTITAELMAAAQDLFTIVRPGPMSMKWIVRNQDTFINFIIAALDLSKEVDSWDVPADRKVEFQKQRIIRRTANYSYRIRAILTHDEDQLVRFVEEEERGNVIVTVPLHVGGFLRQWLWSETIPILVSATLAVGGDFSFIQERLSLEDAQTIDVGTPFDYPSQMVLYVPPKTIKNPSEDRTAWMTAAAMQTERLVRASGGGALLLFTSRQSMEHSRETIGRLIERMGFTVLMQGDEPNKVLARKFMEDTHSVLFALKSFFTGQDFPGHTCFPAGTLVRTSRGYLPIEDIRVGDRVWTHRRRYRHVTATSARPYKGNMVGLTPLGGDEVLMTPEHPVLTTQWGRGNTHGPAGKRARGREDRSRVSLRWVAAKELTKHDVLALPVGEANVRVPTKPLGIMWKSGHTLASRDGGVSWEDTPAFWRLLGLWMAEGHVHRYTEKLSQGGGRGRTYRAVVWSFGSHERDTIAREACDLIYEVFGNKVNPRVVGGGCTVTVKHTAFGIWLERNIGHVSARTKRLPWRLTHHVSEKAREAFLEGYAKGDGHQPANWRAMTATTASWQLAYQLADLAHGLGYVTTVHRGAASKGNPFVAPGTPHWDVSWGRDQRRQSNILGQYVARPVRRLRQVDNFSGLVYNIEVDRDESYTLTGFGVHNCRLVIIDKMPFPVPSDPVFKARADVLDRKSGASVSFSKLSVPMMTLTLLQGVGRLIRTKSDRGVVAILDSRLESKGYGRKIVRSLPPARKTTDLSEVERFYA